MKILISWLAYENDFIKGEAGTSLPKVNTEGPTYHFHRYHWQHDKHIILSSAKKSDLRLEMLVNKLRTDFPNHNIEEKYMQINDVIDINEIRIKAESLLIDFNEHEIDVFFSPGTSAMQIAWYMCHSSMGLKTRLIQTRAPHLSKNKQPELIVVELEKSKVPYSLMARAKSIDDSYTKTEKRDFIIPKSLEDAYEKARMIGQTPGVSALITGETGTGKEVLASYIHNNSIRKNKPFEPINCSAFSDQLLESRLFGHKKGAFTGAVSDSKGIFEKAEGGIVFLDEIGDISPYMQQSLLRVLSENEIMPIGGDRKNVDVQIIAATNKDLRKLCEENKFRWDLYYRLAVAIIELPPLQARGNNEKQTFINYFIDKKQSYFGWTEKLKFSNEAMLLMLNYHYPGNIRELENIIEFCYTFCNSEVQASDLPPHVQFPETESDLTLDAAALKHVAKVFAMTGNNIQRTARILGIAPNTLKNKYLKPAGLI